MKIRLEEEGHEEKRGEFGKIELILISGENKTMVFFLQDVRKPVC